MTDMFYLDKSFSSFKITEKQFKRSSSVQLRCKVNYVLIQCFIFIILSV